MDNEHEHDEELDEEEIARRKAITEKYRKKTNALMAEMAEEMVDEEVQKKIEDKIKDILADQKVPFTLTHMKAFNEGMTLMMSAIGEREIPAMLFMVTKMIIARKEKAVNEQVEKSTKENGL